MTLKQLLHNDDSAVSPVIGVILMVAITVILAAVIASFVLGLGDQGDPAPQPTIESDFSQQSLNFSVTGGDDFEAGVATINADVTVSNTTSGTENGTFSFSSQAIDSGGSKTVDLNSDGGGNDVTMTYISTSGGQVSAGDDFSFGFSAADDFEISDWEVEVVWNPSGQDSQIVYSDSS